MKCIDAETDRKQNELFNAIKDSIRELNDYGIEMYAEKISDSLYNRVQDLISRRKQELKELKETVESLEKKQEKLKIKFTGYGELHRESKGVS